MFYVTTCSAFGTARKCKNGYHLASFDEIRKYQDLILKNIEEQGLKMSKKICDIDITGKKVFVTELNKRQQRSPMFWTSDSIYQKIEYSRAFLKAHQLLRWYEKSHYEVDGKMKTRKIPKQTWVDESVEITFNLYAVFIK